MKMVECHKCNCIVELHGCRVKTVEQESGSTAGSWTFGGWGSSGSGGNRRGSGVRYNAGRTYYRKVKVYTCPDCATKSDGNIVKIKTSHRQLEDTFNVFQNENDPIEKDEESNELTPREWFWGIISWGVIFWLIWKYFL